MNYDEITKITAERISDYMTEAVNTDSIAVAEMFHNAAWGVRTLWFELVTKIDIDIHKRTDMRVMILIDRNLNPKRLKNTQKRMFIQHCLRAMSAPPSIKWIYFILTSIVLQTAHRHRRFFSGKSRSTPPHVWRYPSPGIR